MGGDDRRGIGGWATRTGTAKKDSDLQCYMMLHVCHVCHVYVLFIIFARQGKTTGSSTNIKIYIDISRYIKINGHVFNDFDDLRAGCLC